MNRFRITYKLGDACHACTIVARSAFHALACLLVQAREARILSFRQEA